MITVSVVLAGKSKQSSNPEKVASLPDPWALPQSSQNDNLCPGYVRALSNSFPLMGNGELIPNLFRTQYRKIVSVLCKRFGIEQIEIAEDIASDTFLTASETWG